MFSLNPSKLLLGMNKNIGPKVSKYHVKAVWPIYLYLSCVNVFSFVAASNSIPYASIKSDMLVYIRTPKLNQKKRYVKTTIQVSRSNFLARQCFCVIFHPPIVCVYGTTSFVLLLTLLLPSVLVVVRYVWLPKFQCHRMPKRCT